jgi:hypothetical protein
MTEIIPEVSGVWTVTGQLRDAEFPELLNATMIDVYDSARDILIYGGWEPEEDPTGHYVIGAVRGTHVLIAYRTRNIEQAALLIQNLAEFYSDWTESETHLVDSQTTRTTPCPDEIFKSAAVGTENARWTLCGSSC